MKIHQHLSKQQRYARDIYIFSGIIIGVIVIVMLFSFGMQQLYTAQRNQGREIRTMNTNYIVEVFKTRTHVTLLYLNSTLSLKEMQTLRLEERILTQEHAYMSRNFLTEHVQHVFLSGEQTFAIMLNFIQLFEHKEISESLVRLFIQYTSTYTNMLVQLNAEYTNILAQNNANASTYAVCELFSELLLFGTFFFVVLRPAIRKFVAISRKSDELQQRLIETHGQVRNMQREQGKSVMLARDVVCVDHHMYSVAHQGSTMTVFYNEKAELFICECKMYVQDRFCFHTNRARWLHNKIYRRISAR